MLLIRLLPWLTALFAFVAAQYQWTHLLSYPLPLVIWFVWFVFAILLIRWSKVSFRATFEKMTPAVFAAAGAILAFLMAQDAVQRLGLTLALVTRVTSIFLLRL
jgi:hypothetical protein